MYRVPVVDKDGKPLMPTKPARARKWIDSGKAVKQWSDCGQFYVQLTVEPSGHEIQDIIIGIDPGKHFSGIGVQSAKATLYAAHLALPFKTVRERMENRRLMRRGRRGRRINRKVSFRVRAHRQKRFDNRRQGKLPPSSRANRQVEGFKTASTRKHLELVKNKVDKSKAELATHAVDGVALACTHFVQYRKYHRHGEDGADWFGSVSVNVTAAPFFVIRRPPISRRQLHLMVPAQGGVRRKYGGTVTRQGYRKCDLVRAEMGGKVHLGWVIGDTQKQVSVSDCNWKRLGQFAASKVCSIARSTNLVVFRPPLLSLPMSKGRGFSEVFR